MKSLNNKFLSKMLYLLLFVSFMVSPIMVMAKANSTTSKASQFATVKPVEKVNPTSAKKIEKSSVELKINDALVMIYTPSQSPTVELWNKSKKDVIVTTLGFYTKGTAELTHAQKMTYFITAGTCVEVENPIYLYFTNMVEAHPLIEEHEGKNFTTKIDQMYCLQNEEYKLFE